MRTKLSINHLLIVMHQEVSFELKDNFISPWKRSQNTFDRLTPEALRMRFLSNNKELQTQKESVVNLPSQESLMTPVCEQNYKTSWYFQKRFHQPLFTIWSIQITKGFALFLLISLLLYVLTAAVLFKFTANKSLMKKTGFLVSLAGFFLFTFATKKSFWAYVMGLEFDKALLFHKACAILMIGFAIVHWYVVKFKLSGYLLFGTILLSSGLAFYKIRRQYFRLFYFSHIALMSLIVIFALWHEATLVFVGFLLWVVDLVLRAIQLKKFKSQVPKARLNLLADNLLEIEFASRNFDSKAGQWVFLLVPELTIWEFHPFSIVENLSTKQIKLYIKVLGDWTLKLANLARTTNEISILIDGPYGNTAIDIHNPKYQQFLLIGGGIGITPLLSIANTLVSEFLTKRTFRFISFVWSVRTTAELAAILNEQHLIIQMLNAYYQDEELLKSPEAKCGFDLQIFVTLENDAGNYERFSNAVRKNMVFKKLDLGPTFFKVKQECSAANDFNVAVLCSGPEGLMQDATRYSAICQFDIHCESFDF